MRMTAADHDKVGAAIAAAEEGSAGEIVAIATDLSDPYHDVGLHYAVLATFVVLGVFAFSPASLEGWFARLHGFIMFWRERLYAFVRASSAWQAVASFRIGLRGWFAHRRPGRIALRLRALLRRRRRSVP